MSISVLIPYRAAAGSDRERIWAWIRQRWERTMPECELVVCSDGGEEGERFNEGRARNACARAATGDVFLLADSETACNPGHLRDAIDLLIDEEQTEPDWPWGVAEAYYQLTTEATERLLTLDPAAPLSQPELIDTARGFFMESVASIIVVPREAYEAVGGYDERYVGWGHIDKAFAAALDTLWGPHRRYRGWMIHLDHARTERRDCNPELSTRYLAANGDADTMRAILEER